MKEPESYFEWELQFKPKIKAKSSKKKREKFNILGIKDKEFVNAVKNWKKQNKI